jgi:hypothetical protein
MVDSLLTEAEAFRLWAFLDSRREQNLEFIQRRLPVLGSLTGNELNEVCTSLIDLSLEPGYDLDVPIVGVVERSEIFSLPPLVKRPVKRRERVACALTGRSFYVERPFAYALESDPNRYVSDELLSWESRRELLTERYILTSSHLTGPHYHGRR